LYEGVGPRLDYNNGVNFPFGGAAPPWDGADGQDGGAIYKEIMVKIIFDTIQGREKTFYMK